MLRPLLWKTLATALVLLLDPEAANIPNEDNGFSETRRDGRTEATSSQTPDSELNGSIGSSPGKRKNRHPACHGFHDFVSWPASQPEKSGVIVPSIIPPHVNFWGIGRGHASMLALVSPRSHTLFDRPSLTSKIR